MRSPYASTRDITPSLVEAQGEKLPQMFVVEING
jgi:hypothetical protein